MTCVFKKILLKIICWIRFNVNWCTYYWGVYNVEMSKKISLSFMLWKQIINRMGQFPSLHSLTQPTQTTTNKKENVNYPCNTSTCKNGLHAHGALTEKEHQRKTIKIK